MTEVFMLRFAIPVFAFVFGSVLLTLAVPRTIASFVAIPGIPILNKIQNLEALKTKDIEFLIANQGRELFWHGSGRLTTNIGLSQLLLAEKHDRKDPRRQKFINAAINSLKEGLSKGPANPFAWTRLAYALALKDRITPEAMSAFRMGIDLAPVEGRLAMARITFGVAAWKLLTSAEHQFLFRQVRFVWRGNKRGLVKFAMESGQVNFIRAALLPIPKELKKFESHFQWYLKKYGAVPDNK